jgi:hypothetical protein
VLGTKVVSPEYAAVIECDPTTNVDIAMWPLPLVKEAVPKLVEPSMNVTDPVGVPDAGATADTVAVNVTD